MDKIVIVCFTLLLMSKDLGAQALGDLSVYMKNNEVSKSAKDFYAGKFQASDDNRTLSIIDSLETKNNKTRPFYIYLVSKIIQQSDGALSEVLGMSCKKFVESYPDHLVEFLESAHTLVKSKIPGYWAKAIASEFMIDCEGSVKFCVEKSLNKTSGKVKATNKTKLQTLYADILKYCR